MAQNESHQIDEATLQEIVERILSVGSPQKIILFGSHARGDARPGSDLDLLIVEEQRDKPGHLRAAAYYKAMPDTIFPAEIIVYSPQQLRDWAEVPQSFQSTIIREGRVLFQNAI